MIFLPLQSKEVGKNGTRHDNWHGLAFPECRKRKKEKFPAMPFYGRTYCKSEEWENKKSQGHRDGCGNYYLCPQGTVVVLFKWQGQCHLLQPEASLEKLYYKFKLEFRIKSFERSRFCTKKSLQITILKLRFATPREQLMFLKFLHVAKCNLNNLAAKFLTQEQAWGRQPELRPHPATNCPATRRRPAMSQPTHR